MAMKANNIQGILLSLLIISVAILYYFHYSSPSPKVAYINSTKLITEYKGMQEAATAYQAKASVWQANIDTLQHELRTSVEKYEREKLSLSEKEKALTEELLMNKQKQLAEYQNAIQQKAQEEDQAMTQKIMEQVNAEVKAYGKEHKYDVIMAATHAGNLVYAEDALDLTEQILERLNKPFASK